MSGKNQTITMIACHGFFFIRYIYRPVCGSSFQYSELNSNNKHYFNTMTSPRKNCCIKSVYDHFISLSITYELDMLYYGFHYSSLRRLPNCLNVSRELFSSRCFSLSASEHTPLLRTREVPFEACDSCLFIILSFDMCAWIEFQFHEENPIFRVKFHWKWN